MFLICVMVIIDEWNMNFSKGLVLICVGLVVFVIGMIYYFNCGYVINFVCDLGFWLFIFVVGWGDSIFM